MVYRSPQRGKYLPLSKTHQHSQLSPCSYAFCISHTYLFLSLSLPPSLISSSPPLFLLHLPFPRNQQAQPPLRLQKPASLSASATLLQRLVLHASHQSTCFIRRTHTSPRHTHIHADDAQCISLIVIYSLKRPVGSPWQLQCSLTWTIHGC